MIIRLRILTILGQMDLLACVLQRLQRKMEINKLIFSAYLPLNPFKGTFAEHRVKQ